MRINFLCYLIFSLSGYCLAQDFSTGFEDSKAGEAFTVQQWEKAGFDAVGWDNGLAQRAIIDSTTSAIGDKSLRITYPVGESGSVGNGAQIPLILPNKDEYYLSYKLMFSPEFSFRLGGKLPGLAAGQLCSGGQVCDGTNGFTARYMWRKGGEIVLYLYYMNKKGRWGDDFPLIYPSGGRVVLETGKWYQITQRVRVNSAPELFDGEVEVWINGQPVLFETGFRFTINDDKVNRFYFSTFHGGSGSDWAPLKTSYIWFDDIEIYTKDED